MPFQNGYFKRFIKIFTIVLAIVNISAFIYAAVALASTKYPDDVFTGLYGKNGFGSHSLSIINIAVSGYYFYVKKFKKLAFFVLCGVLGFYGLGLLMAILTVAILSIPYLIKKIRLILKGAIFIGLIAWVTFTINPKNLDYILLNLHDASLVFKNYEYKEEMEKATNFKRTFVPRYITFMDGARRLFFSDPKVFILGTSPGGFNSRTAFYLNGDFVQNDFIKKNFSENTSYHEKYVKSLLNRRLITEIPWNDGTRNQPFSSITSILLEYGFFIGLGLLFWFFRTIRSIRKEANSVQGKYIKFLSTFLFLILIVQNYMEYPEIILFFIITIKLIDIDNVVRHEIKQKRI